MRIERIVLENYRQFWKTEILLKRSDSDLHVFLGRNGTGKTNVLNAVNWCLYGDEPHLSKDSQQLPLLNLRTIEQAEDGHDRQVKVEVWARTADGGNLVFTRKAQFRVYADAELPQHLSTTFEARVADKQGDAEILEGDEAISCVERFVPERIREFFFFDGERLDSYFKEATGQNISHAISEISQIDLLERIEDKLSSMSDDIAKEAGKQNPDIEAARQELERSEQALNDIKAQVDECARQVALAKEEIKEFEDKLRGLPDVQAMENERVVLLDAKRKKEGIRQQKLREKQDALFDYGKVLMLWPCIKASLQMIEKKKQMNEMPPTVDKALLRSILEEETCKICGRGLDYQAKQQVTELLEEIRLTSDIAKISRFEEEVSGLSEELGIFETDLSSIERRLNEIGSTLAAYDTAKVRNWHEQRRKWEETRDYQQQRLGILNEQMEAIAKEVAVKKEKLEQEIKREKKVIKLKKQRDFCARSCQVLKQTKEAMMAETREKIERETKELFLSLIWKKETFQDLNIDQDYNLSLTHAIGYECLGSISAAERELLALSFTLALHKVSGFDSPILIDTPVARVSDQNRENLGRVFSEVGKNRQVILLFTPAEFSEEISRVLDRAASTRQALRLSADERETIVEEL
jgi:DNA sulfur modification protein DndD